MPLDGGVMTEEIFGPVLPVNGCGSLDEAVEQIDRTGKPLAMYLFSHAQGFIAAVLDQSFTGGVTINQVLMHYAEGKLPFGSGSGMGRYKGIGFRELSDA